MTQETDKAVSDMPEVIYTVAGNLTTIVSGDSLITGLWACGSMFNPKWGGPPPVKYIRADILESLVDALRMLTKGNKRDTEGNWGIRTTPSNEACDAAEIALSAAETLMGETK